MAASSPAPPPRGLGVSLAALNFAVAAAGGRAVLAEHTTAWLKEHVVLPATATARAPYTAVLAAADAALVGEASAFISHAYAYPFLTVVDAVAAWEARQMSQSAPVYYYFDLFIVYQHGQSAGVAPEVLWAEFAGSVSRVGRTLLVCAWRTEILPFTRCWCLAEIATAVGDDRDASFAIIMPPDEEAAFAESLAHCFDDLVRKACSIDLSLAKAYHCDSCLVDGVCRHVRSQGSDHIDECPNDCAFVRRAVRDSIGFDTANERVVAVVRKWMAGAGLAALEAMPAAERATSDLASGYARLLSDQGRLDEAAPIFLAALEGRRRVLGDAHPRTLAAAFDYARLLAYQARYDAAEPLFREAVACRERALGDSHPDTLIVLHGLALMLHEQRRFDEGDALFSRVVAGRRLALGSTHPATLEAIKGHGVLLEKQRRFGPAADCFREALAGQRSVLGDFHPQTLSTTHKFATLLVAEGRVAEAKPLYLAAHAGRRRVLGEGHPHTLWSISKIAGVCMLEGQPAEAAPLYREAFDGFSRVFGGAHPATLEAARSWDAACALAGGGAGATAAAAKIS